MVIHHKEDLFEVFIENYGAIRGYLRAVKLIIFIQVVKIAQVRSQERPRLENTLRKHLKLVVVPEENKTKISHLKLNMIEIYLLTNEVLWGKIGQHKTNRPL